MGYDDYNGLRPRAVGLSNLRCEMARQGLLLAVFQMKFCDVTCSVVYNASRDAHNITLIKSVTGEVLRFDVQGDDRICIPWSEEGSIKSFFELTPGKFPSKLFLRLARRIGECAARLNFREVALSERARIAKSRNHEDGDKIYLWYLKDQSPSGKCRTEENRRKTRELYPEVEEAIGGLNVSVCYTDDPIKAKSLPCFLDDACSRKEPR